MKLLATPTLTQLLRDLEMEATLVRDPAYRAGVEAVLTRLSQSQDSPETFRSLALMEESFKSMTR